MSVHEIRFLERSFKPCLTRFEEEKIVRSLIFNFDESVKRTKTLDLISHSILFRVLKL